MDFIGGEDREQTQLLPDSLEDYVNEDNPVRVIDAFVNGLDMHGLGFRGSSRTAPAVRPTTPWAC
jgi:transposase